MKPRKEIIEKAIQNGAMDRINQLLSANQVLMGVSSRLTDEASELLQKNGLLIGPLKKKSNDVVKAADLYFTEFGQMITEKSKAMDMHKDIDDFEFAFRRWAKLLSEEDKKRGRKPMRGVKKIANQFAGKSSCKNCPIYAAYGHCLNEEVLKACRYSYVKGFKKGIEYVRNK